MGTALTYKVLVLNRLWQAVNVVGVQPPFICSLIDQNDDVDWEYFTNLKQEA
jgi:hypothetical protein